MNSTQLFEEFKTKRILVVGDVMVDAYMRGKVTRISPEAPVPIVTLESDEQRLGGAANVALNLASLGAIPILCSIIGDDKGGERFKELLQEGVLSTMGIVMDPGRKTTVKTRIIGNNQQLIRVDDEEVKALNPYQENLLINAVKNLISSVDAMILEDYNKGLLTPYVIRELIHIANENGVISTVDPKKENFLAYKGVTLFKPNLKELKEGLNLDGSLVPKSLEFELAVAKLEQLLNQKYSFITLSEHGVYIKAGEAAAYIPAHVRNISDVSGAGDTVIATVTLCMASGVSVQQAAEIANIAGGLVCEFTGVVPIERELLKTELERLLKGEIQEAIKNS